MATMSPRAFNAMLWHMENSTMGKLGRPQINEDEMKRKVFKPLHSVTWKDEYGKRYTISGINYIETRLLFKWIQNQEGFQVLNHEVHYA